MARKQQSVAISDFNMKKISTKELSEHVAASIQAESNICVFGRRGVGKTEIAKYEIAKAGLREVYINLSVFERPDMGGYPDVMSSARQKEFVDFLLPTFYEPMIKGNEKVIALLDEVDKADQSLWAPLLEFTQFHSISGRPLPNLKGIIMTGNLISEGGQRPSPPLLDRTEKYLVEADSESWLNWAGQRGHIHPAITAYIADHPKDLFGGVDPDDRYADPSPRSWTRASSLVFKGEKFGWNTDILNSKVSGCVGKDAGIRYSNYFDHYQQLLPMIEELFHGKDIKSKYTPLEPTRKIVTCMITSARLSALLDNCDPNNLPKKAVNAIEYVGKFLNYAGDENVLVSVRSQIQIERLMKYNIDEQQDWKTIITKISDKINGN
jgi:hypothetical protein